MGYLSAILSWLSGPITRELREWYKLRLEAKNDDDRIAADIRIKELEAERDERRQKLADPILKFPLFFAEFCAALYIGAILIDSTFPMVWLTPLELPEWFKLRFDVIVVSIFGISAVDRFISRRKR